MKNATKIGLSLGLAAFLIIMAIVNAGCATGYDPGSSWAPTVSTADAPAKVLPNAGSVVIHRFTVEAPSERDLFLAKASFRSMIHFNGSPRTASVSNPRLREVGAADDLLTLGEVKPTACSPLSGDSLCFEINLSFDEMIEAGDAKTYDLRVDTAGFVHNNGLATVISVPDNVDNDGMAAGEVTGAVPDLGIDGIRQNFIWSDDGIVWRGAGSVGLGRIKASLLFRN